MAGAVAIPFVFRSNAADPYALTKAILLRVLIVIAMIPVLVWVARDGADRLLRWGPIDIAIGVFVALNLLSLLFSDDRNRSFYGEDFQFQGLLTLLLYVASLYLARIAFPEITEMQARAIFTAGPGWRRLCTSWAHAAISLSWSCRSSTSSTSLHRPSSSRVRGTA